MLQAINKQPASPLQAAALEETELLRFTTAGSVDDGKSTLIGRLLVDAKGVFEDQLDAARGHATRMHAADGAELALLTDGLAAEREQGITIDVAWRYFATPKRKFIIADTPGHAQYTRNMVTGASTAELALLLLDARHGVLTQTRRHACIARLLGVSHVVAVVNKMDMVGYEQAAYERVRDDFLALCQRIGLKDVKVIPISALVGDMVVTRGDRLSWYEGPTLLEQLENVPLLAPHVEAPLRFPVQWVNRPQGESLHDFRGYCGRIVSGRVRVGDEVLIQPGGERSRVREIITFDGPLWEAVAPLSVTLTLEDDVDVSRGDMLVPVEAPAPVRERIEATVCWMDKTPLQPGSRYLLKHGSRQVRVLVQELGPVFDIEELETRPADRFELNDIGHVVLRLQAPLACDDYAALPATGSFILIDEFSYATSAAGMIGHSPLRQNATESHDS